MNSRKKLLFIPADVIRNEVSRSFYFAKYLSAYYDLYFLSRFDPQNAYFENRKRSKFFTLTCFFRSIFVSTRYHKHEKWNYTVVHVPFMSHMVIHRLLGMVMALKISRAFNKFFLKKIARRIQPDIIFHADGFDLYPSLKEFFYVSDIQDDFDKGNFRDNDYNVSYVKEQLSYSGRNFVVSKKAAEGLGAFYKREFIYEPNGVELEAMMQVNKDVAGKIKQQYGLTDKFIVSYIGADAWYDQTLIRTIFDLTWKADPSIHFLIIGNLPKIEAPNVTFTGPVSKDDSYHYYWVSDAGVLLKDSRGSNFLYNSIPLKIIQYGVANKWFISPPIAWLEQENFQNIQLLPEYSAPLIVGKILELKNTGLPTFDNSWLNYSWEQIGKHIHEEIASAPNPL